jgi:heme/copper-type cytochrome/quinol oxidase subunit 3
MNGLEHFGLNDESEKIVKAMASLLRPMDQRLENIERQLGSGKVSENEQQSVSLIFLFQEIILFVFIFSSLFQLQTESK